MHNYLRSELRFFATSYDQSAFISIGISMDIFFITGIALSTRHFRAGKELPMLAENKHYDFNYQVSFI